MSGIEVAGLILGAIPLVISGLEHYAEGVSTIKIMFNAPSEFKSLSRRLRVEQKIFKNAIELLLHDCIDDDQMLADLMSDTADSKLWSDPEVGKALRQKLQTSYSVYLDTMTSLETTLLEFRERLKLNDDGKVKERPISWKAGMPNLDHTNIFRRVPSQQSVLASNPLTSDSISR